MRWPAMGLSNPPLRRRTPARTTSNPHVLRVHAAGLRLVLHAANQRAPVRKDREATSFHVGNEDAARKTCGAEAAESAREAVEVDRAAMDRVEGDRVAPAKGREDLRAPRPDIVALTAHAGGTVRTPCRATGWRGPSRTSRSRPRRRTAGARRSPIRSGGSGSRGYRCRPG